MRKSGRPTDEFSEPERVANALGHLLGSAYLRTTLPGMCSSPLLLVAAAWMVFQGLTGRRPAVGH